MDFQGQRFRDRLRSEGRSRTNDTVHRIRNMLDRYVSVRQGTAPSVTPVQEILWGRIALAVGSLVGLVVVVALIVHVIRR